MLGSGKARGVCVARLMRTYHWFKSMGREDIQLKKGGNGGDCALYGLVGLVGRMKHEIEL